MKTRWFSIILLFSIAAGLVACGKNAEQSSTGDDQSAAMTATAEALVSTIPADVPIMEGAFNMKLAANNTYISYQVEGALDDVVQSYRDQLAELGWERRGNSPESPIGGAQTLLRYKPEKNISVTIQSIQDSSAVRILITIIPTK